MKSKTYQILAIAPNYTNYKQSKYALSDNRKAKDVILYC